MTIEAIANIDEEGTLRFLIAASAVQDDDRGEPPFVAF